MEEFHPHLGPIPLAASLGYKPLLVKKAAFLLAVQNSRQSGNPPTSAQQGHIQHKISCTHSNTRGSAPVKGSKQWGEGGQMIDSCL